LVNEGDFITIAMLRVAMIGADPVITGVTVVRCNCDSTCSVCEDAGEPPNIPGSTTPGSTTPGSTTPGSGTPGSTTPGSGTPGSETSGNTTPGSGASRDGTPRGGLGGGQGSGTDNTGINPGLGINPANQVVPRTGDEANMVLWIVLFAVGLLGLVSILIKLIMNRRKQMGTPTITIEGDDNQEIVIEK
jgi:hypothetical protein